MFATNNFMLQTGFYLFTGYFIIGLLLSAMIDKRMGSAREPTLRPAFLRA